MNLSKTPLDINGKPLGMAWYKFLIYFSLIAGAIINLIYSFNYISGGIYFVETNGEVSAEQVYAYYGTGLQVVDVFYGFFLVTFAILAFVVRHKLANYKPDSLKFVKIFYSLSAGVPFLYAILVTAITGQSLAVQAVTSAIVSLVFLLLNIKYFKKRAHLFIEEVSCGSNIDTVVTYPAENISHDTVREPSPAVHTLNNSKTVEKSKKKPIIGIISAVVLVFIAVFIVLLVGNKDKLTEEYKGNSDSSANGNQNTPSYEDVGVAFDQYTLAGMISDDPLTYCEYIVELDKTLSKGSYGIDIQKEKATEYVNNLPLDYGQRIILFKIQFPNDTTYCSDIVDYLNEREDISYDDEVFILEELGFAVFEDGTIKW